MPIKHYFVPKSPITHILCEKIETLKSCCENTNDFIQFVEEWKSWDNNEQIELHYFLHALNKIDSILENFLKNWQRIAILTDERVDYEATIDEAYESDCNIVRIVLKFSAMLLGNTVEKGIFSSTEYLVTLLKAFDSDIAMLALEALSMLAIPPMYHRCHLDWNAHSTPLHKNMDHSDSMFVIIDAAKDVRSDSYLSVETLAVPGAIPNQTSSIITLDMTSSTKDVNIPSNLSDNLVSFRVESSMNDVVDVSHDRRHIAEIINDPTIPIPKDLRFIFLWKYRMIMMRKVDHTAWLYYKAYYAAITILLCCYQDPYYLQSYFQDKHDIAKDFIYLLKSGPGSEEYSSRIPLDLRILASNSLQALFGSEESVDVGVFGRLIHLQYNLGLGRGQYMGLLPCLLRSSASYIVSIAQGQPTSSYTESSSTSTTVSSTPRSKSNDLVTSASLIGSKSSSKHHNIVEPTTSEHYEQLLWIESLFLFTLSVLQFAETGQYLPENGLLSSLLAILKIPPFRHRSRIWSFVHALVIMVGDTCLGIGQVCSSFLRQDGLELVLQQVKAELDLLFHHSLSLSSSSSSASSMITPRSKRSYSIDVTIEDHVMDYSHLTHVEIETIVSPSRIILQHLLSMLNMVLEKGLQDSHDHRVIQQFKSASFAQSLSRIYTNLPILTTRLGAVVDALVTDMINFDPSTPAMLVHLCQSGVIKLLLQHYVDDKSSSVSSYPQYQSEAAEAYIIDRANLFFSIALTSPGLNLLREINPFPKLLSIFYDQRYAYPYCRVLSMDLIRSVGSSLEEILRHYPELSEFVLDAILEVIHRLTGPENDDIYHDTMMTERYISQLHFITSILHCLSSLLTRAPTVSMFISKNGIQSLAKVLPIALGPHRYFLVNLSCAVNSTSHFLGNTDTITALTLCLTSIMNLKQKECIEVVVDSLDKQLDVLSDDMYDYWTHIMTESSSSTPMNDHLSNHVKGAGWRQNKLLFKDFINTVNQLPLQNADVFVDGNPVNGMIPRLNLFTIVNKSIISISYMINILFPLSTSSSLFSNTNNASSSTSLLASDKLYEIASYLSSDFYLGAQYEITRHTQSTMLTVKHFAEKYVKKPHPIYTLLITAEAGVWIRTGIEDNSKKLYGIPKGTIIEAYERKQVGGKIVKYHVEDGWISCFKKMSSYEPTLEVIDIHMKSIERLENDLYESASSNDPIDTNSENRSLSDISASRSGYISLFHVSFSIRIMIESISKNISSTMSGMFGMALSTRAQARLTKPQMKRNISLISNLLHQVTIELTRLSPLMSKPSSSTSSTYDNQHHSELESSSITPLQLDDPFFHKYHTPMSLDDCNISFVYLTLTTIDLCCDFLFASKSGQELNILLLLHLFYNNTLESLIQASLIVFSCTYEIKSEDMRKAYNRSSFASSLSYEHYESIIKDRRKFALESASGIIEFWNKLFIFLSHSSSSIERNLMKSSPDASHDYDAYIFRRKLSLLLMRYLSPNTLAHVDGLLSLPVSTVKALLEMMSHAVKSIQEVKSLPNTFSNQSKSWAVDMKTGNIVTSSTRPRSNSLSNANTSSSSSSARFGIGSIADLASNTLSSVARRFHTRLRQQRSNNDNDPISSGLSRSRPAFTPNPSSILAMQDMGFHRNAVLRAIHSMRSNNVSALAEYITEQQFDDSAVPDSILRDLNMLPSTAGATSVTDPTISPPPSSSSSSAQAAADNVIEASSTEAPPEASLSSSSSSSSASSNRHSFGYMPGLRFQNMMDDPFQPMSSLDDDNSNDNQPDESSSSSATAGGDDTILLPIIHESSKADNSKDRRLIARVLDHIFELFPTTCMKLIESGFDNMKALQVVSAEIIEENKIYSRDVTIVMLLNQLIACLDRRASSKLGLKVNVLSWFFHRAQAYIHHHLSSSSANDDDKHVPLFGMLHAINVLFYGHASVSPSTMLSGGNSKPQSDQQNLIILLFTRDERFISLYDNIIIFLEKYSHISSSATDMDDASMNHDDGMIIAHEWIPAALLLLDVASQEFFIDRDAISDLIRDTSLDGVDIAPSPIDDHLTPKLTLSSSSHHIPSYHRTSSTSSASSLSKVYRISLERQGQSVDDREQHTIFTAKFQDDLKITFGVPVSEDIIKRSSNQEVSDDDTSTSSEKKNEDSKSSSSSSSAAGDINASNLADDDISSKRSIQALAESTLSYHQRCRIIRSCFLLLQHQQHHHKPSSSSSSYDAINTTITHAILQLLVHLSSQLDTRSTFIESHAVDLLLSITYPYPGIEAMVFTLLQRFLETEESLATIMMMELKSCYLKLEKKKSTSSGAAGSNKVTLSSFVDMIAPMIYRHPNMFMKMMKKHFIVSMSTDGNNMNIEWNMNVSTSSADDHHDVEESKATHDDPTIMSSSSSSSKRKSISNIDAMIDSMIASTENGSNTSSLNQKRRRLSDGEAGAKRYEAISQAKPQPSSSSSSSSSSSLRNDDTQQVVSCIMNKIVIIWRSFKQSVYDKHTSTIGYLSIADYIYMLSDLVGTIPGVATCIHRYMIHDHQLIANISSSPINGHKPANLAQISFLSFLIYNFLLDSPDKDIINYKDMDEKKDDDKDKMVSSAAHRRLGSSYRDSVAYLIGALISRPGEGRKRTISELVDVMKLSSTSSSSGVYHMNSHPNALASLLVMIEVIGCLLSPPVRWKSRETFIVPSIDVLYYMSKLDFHIIAGKLLYSISLDDPLAVEVASKLSTLIDVFLRKGTELVLKIQSHHHKTASSSISKKHHVDPHIDSSASSASTAMLLSPIIRSSSSSSSQPLQFEDIVSPGELQHRDDMYHHVTEDDTPGIGEGLGLSSSMMSQSHDARGGLWTDVVNDSSESEGAESDADDDSQNDHDSNSDDNNDDDDDDDDEQEQVYDSMYHRPRGRERIQDMERDDDEDSEDDDEEDSDDDDHEEGDDDHHDEEHDHHDDVGAADVHDDYQINMSMDVDQHVAEDDDDFDDEDEVDDDHPDEDDIIMIGDDGEPIDEEDDIEGDDEDDDDNDNEDDHDGFDVEVIEYDEDENDDDQPSGDDEDDDEEDEDDDNADDLHPGQQVSDQHAEAEAEDDEVDDGIDIDDDDEEQDGDEVPTTSHGTALPEGMDVVFEDQWQGMTHSLPVNHDNDEDNDSNYESPNDASHDSGDDNISSPFRNHHAGRASHAATVGNMELNVHGLGDPIRFSVNFDHSSDPMDIFHQVINRTMRIRSSNNTSSPVRGSSYISGNNAMGSASRRRSSGSRRQSRDWTNMVDFSSNNRRTWNMNRDDDDDEDMIDNVLNSFSNARGGASSILGGSVFISDRNGTREIDSSASSAISSFGQEISNLLSASRPMRRSSATPSGAGSSGRPDYWSTVDSSRISDDVYRSLLVDINRQLPQELAERPTINPLLASMDVLRLSRSSNRSQLRASAGRFGSQSSTSSSNTNGLLSSSLQTTLSSQSQILDQNMNIFAVVDHRANNANNSTSSSTPPPSAMITNATISSNIRSYVRIPRASVSVTRRQAGAIASDRRWGVDVGAIQSAGENIALLTQAIQHELEEKNPDIKKPSNDKAASKDHRKLKRAKDNKASMPSYVRWTDVFADPRLGSSNNNISSSSSRGRIADQAGMMMEESKEEGELQESKDNDDVVANHISTLPVQSEVSNAVPPITHDNDTSTSNNEPSSSENQVSEQPITSSLRPPHIDASVWDALPLEMQIEMLSTSGHDTSALIESEIASSNMDRDTLMSLPPALMTQVLVQESTERKRRMSFDQSSYEPMYVIDSSSSSSSSSNPVSMADASALPTNILPPSSSSSSSTSTTATASLSQSQDNIDFINTLSFDLRQEVLATAEEPFLASLTSSMREEARQVRLMLGLPASTINVDPISMPSHPDPVDLPDLPGLADFNNSFQRFLASQQLQQPSSTLTSGAAVLPNADNAATASSSSRPVRQRYPNRYEIAARFAAENGLSVPSSSSSNVPPLGGASSFLLSNGNLLPMRPSSSGRHSSSRNRYLLNSTDTNNSNTSNESSMIVTRPVDRPVPNPFTETHLSIAEENIIVYYRLLKCILCLASRNKAPRPILKLVSSLTLFHDHRHMILQSLFAAISNDYHHIIHHITSSQLSSSIALNDDTSYIQKILPQVTNNPLTLRRLLHSVSYLSRKTGRIVWYDIMHKPAINSTNPWLFRILLSLLRSPSSTSSMMTSSSDDHTASLNSESMASNIDALLHLIEELVVPLSRITVIQANQLIEAQKLALATSSSSSTANDQVTLNEVEDPPLKRMRTTDSDMHDDNEPTMTSTSYDQPVVAQPSSSAMEVISPLPSSSSGVTSSMPFPLLEDSDAHIIASFTGSETGLGATHRKRLPKILRVLSLADDNWKLLLHHLGNIASQLASSVCIELDSLLSTLRAIKPSSSSCQHHQAPSNINPDHHHDNDDYQQQHRLLHVLESMTLLRSRSSASAGAESLIIAEAIKHINFGECWSMLFECLDHVREMEGLTYDIDDDTPSSSTSSSAATGTNAASPTPASSSTPSTARNRHPRATPRHNSSSSSNVNHHQLSAGAQAHHRMEDSRPLSSLSALTMRFIPLIECFLLVCGSTILKKHQPSSTSPPPTVTAAHDISIPGQRFRQHASYYDMQMEVHADDPISNYLLSFVDKNRLLLNILLKSNIHLLDTSFSPLILIPRCRHLLHFDIKRCYFKMKLKKLKQQAQRQALASSTSSNQHLHMKVRRDEVFVDSFRHLRYKSAEDMKKRLSVEFMNEEGMDAGGLTREWYSVLAKEIFNANYALFNATNDHVTFQPNPQSFINPEHLFYFKFVGRVIGKAVLDNHLFDAHFTRAFYKHMLGMTVNMNDLEHIEPDYYRSLRQLLDTPLDDLGLDLTFATESHNFGRVEVVDLIDGGRDIVVTDENKAEYIRLVANFRMVTAIHKQIDSFLEGFHELIPPELISIFDAHELELLISGLPEIDLDDLRAHTEYDGGYKATDPTIQHFWTVLRSLNKEEKALFLQFVTGTSKVPLEGFRALRGSDGVRFFNIHKAHGGLHLLPTAHTCFNQLDLPEYETEEELKEKLLVAIKEGSEGFGFA